MSETAATPSPFSPQDQVAGLLMGMIQGRAVVCAAELGIAEALGDDPLSVEELASRTGTHPGNLFRLLRALESISFFRKISPGFHFVRWSDLVMMTGVGAANLHALNSRICSGKAGFELEDTVPTASHYTIVIGRPC